MGEPMIRAVTSASNIFRRAACPGSERLEAGLPEEDSEYSREGVLLHKHDADPALDRSKLKLRQRDLLETAAKLDEEVFRRVHEQFRFGEAKAEEAGRERTMYLHRGIKSLFPGTCDLWRNYAAGGVLVIIDKKFGYQEVTPAAANLQLRAYAVMGAELHDCDYVVVAITQPRLAFDQRLTLAVYSRADIAASRKQLYDIWDGCKKPDAPLVAGEEQCRYCRAKLICPAYQKSMTDGMAIIPFPSPELSKTARETFVEHRLQECTDDQLMQLYGAVHLAGYVKDPLFDECRKRKADGRMPALKLGKPKTLSEVTDPAAAFEILTEQAGFTTAEVLATCKMRLSEGDHASITETLREKMKCTWKIAKDKVNELLGGVIEKNECKPSVLRAKEALPES